MYTPRNYRLINYFCRDNNYGGVAIYFREVFNMDFEILDLSKMCEPKLFEVVGVKIQTIQLILIPLYRTPDSTSDSTPCMAAFLGKLDTLFDILKKYFQYCNMNF